MQKNKAAFVSTLMILLVIILPGCTTTYLDMKKWHGRTVNDLYFDRGKADEVEVLGGGKRVHIWHSKKTVNGEVKTCTKKFYTKNAGHNEVITNTKYTGCLFLIAK